MTHWLEGQFLRILFKMWPSLMAPVVIRAAAKTGHTPAEVTARLRLRGIIK